MKDYVVITYAELAIVEKEVRQLLNDGWTVAGGISMAYKHEHGHHGEHVHGHLVYAQAMVRVAD
jgi:hypothetical protein